jgi:hypothetical protein
LLVAVGSGEEDLAGPAVDALGGVLGAEDPEHALGVSAELGGAGDDLELRKAGASAPSGVPECLIETPVGRAVEMLEVRSVPVGALEVHPDAEQYGADNDDRAALRVSTTDVGMLEPLTCIRTDAGALQVVDGCGRLAAARELALGLILEQDGAA